MESVSSPALSPDGNLLAYGSDSNLYVRPISGGPAIKVAGNEDTGFPYLPRWSPDGRQLAFLRLYCRSCNHRLFVKDYPTGAERLLGDFCGAAPSWTPDGKSLIAAEQAGQYPGWPPCRIVRVPVDGGARVRLANEGDQLALTADGRRLAYAAGHIVKTVALDAAYRFTSVPTAIAKEPHEISSLHWSHDGRSLLYESWGYTKAITDRTARVVATSNRVLISQILPDGSVLGVEEPERTVLWRHDVKANTEPQKYRTVPWTDDHLAVSPAGDQIAFETIRNGTPQIWISKIDGSNARVLVSAIPPFHRYGDRTMVTGLSWSPDGKWIAMGTDPGIGRGDTSGRIFVVSSKGGIVRKLADYGSVKRTPLSASDSSAVYVTDYKGKYFAANLATGGLSPAAAVDLPAPSPYVEGGRYDYYVKRPEIPKQRMVRIEGLFQETQKAR